MRRTVRYLVVGLAALTTIAASLLLAAPSEAQTGVLAEDSLPSSTLVFIEIDSMDRFRASLMATQYGRLFSDPAMRPMLDDIATKLEKGSRKQRNSIGVSLLELLLLPQGSLSIAVVAPGEADQQKLPVAFVISVDAGLMSIAMEAALAKSTMLAQEDHTVSTEMFRGLELTIIRPSEGENSEEPSLVWTRSGAIFHMASDVGVLKSVLGRARGGEKSALFRRVRKRAGAEAQIVWFVDLERLIELGVARATAQGMANAHTIGHYSQLLGLDHLKSIGGGLALNVGEFDHLSKWFIEWQGPPQGLIKVFPLPTADLTPEPCEVDPNSWAPIEAV